MKIDMKKETMNIIKIDEKKRMIHIQLASKKVLAQILMIEIKKEKNFDEKKVLQAIINEEEDLKAQR
jgi:hypothetical protein